VVSGQAPRYVEGPAAEGWLYPLQRAPWRSWLTWFSAVTIGHVIIYRPGTFDSWPGRLILAHELAHTRQHDRLGPLYLPAHLLAQGVSALLSLRSRSPRVSRVHDGNPLEETWICLGVSACHQLGRVDELSQHPQGRLAVSLLAALGA